jgi:hypothetical protein
MELGLCSFIDNRCARWYTTCMLHHLDVTYWHLIIVSSGPLEVIVRTLPFVVCRFQISHVMKPVIPLLNPEKRITLTDRLHMNHTSTTNISQIHHK